MDTFEGVDKGTLALRAECLAHVALNQCGYTSGTYYVSDGLGDLLTLNDCNGTNDTYKNSIVGVRFEADPEADDPIQTELAHWVYIDSEGILYTWDSSGATAFNKLNGFSQQPKCKNTGLRQVVLYVKFE